MQQLEERIVFSTTRQGWLDRTAQRLQQALHGVFGSSKTARGAKDFLNGVWLAHPLHPAVTDVPVGAWTTALVLDGLEATSGRQMDNATSAVIGIGIGGALASAVSGLADWTDTSGDQRRVGLVHATLNTLALGLYGASLWRRLSGHRSSGKALSTAGYLAVVAGAYLGGELAYRLGTQVDRNAWVKGPREFTPAMRESDLPEGQPTRVDVQGVPLMLVRREGEIFALNHVCSHAGGPLSEGKLEDRRVTCPWHGSTYRLEDGSVIHGPAPFPQPHYQVRVRAGQIEVRTALQ